MKRFDDKLINKGDFIEVETPNDRKCIVKLNKVGSEKIYDIIIYGKHIVTLSRRWNWDNFVNSELEGFIRCM
jgi:hypothetical protein